MQNFKLLQEINKIDRRLWSDFIINHEDGNFFYLPEAFDFLKHTKNFDPFLLTVLTKENEIAGMFSGMLWKDLKPIKDKFFSRVIIHGGQL